jgi:NodT family efflux transporter outer membrane factor (OMF) lipoprotein
MTFPRAPGPIRLPEFSEESLMIRLVSFREWTRGIPLRLGLIGSMAGLLLASLLAGCMIGPDYKTPPASIATKWEDASNPAVDTSRLEYADWWSVFNDPVLTRLVGIAYAQNLTLRTAGVRVLQARAQLGVAIGELYPQQQYVNGALSYNRLPSSLPYNLINNVYGSDSFGAQAGWEIDLWGKLRRAIQSADDAFLSSVANYDDVLVTLTGDVASTYVEIRTSQTQLHIAQENIVREKKSVQIAKAKHAGGVVTGRDVYQAENVLGSTEATIPQLDLQLQTQKNALSVLLGMAPGAVDGLLGGATGIPTAPLKIAAGVPGDLMARRPDIRQAELDAAAQCAQIGFTKADLLPVLTLMGSVGTVSSTIGNSALGDVFTSASVVYSVGPSFQWNLLNYGQITNNVRVQDAKFQELLINFQNVVLKAQQEVADGITAFIQARQAVIYLTASVKAAEGALRIALIQYQEGILDFTTVLTAEQNLYQAQNNLAIWSGQVPLGLIAAYRAMGGGWQIRAGHNFIPAETVHEMEDRTNWGTLLTPELTRPRAPGLPSTQDTGPLVRPPEF